MCRSLADRLRRRGDDEGFGLIEIMISMVVFGVVAAGTAPLLLGGLKAGRSSQLNLQAKALGQERLELMRNLPYHVARQNGQYLDVLDLYFRDLQPSGTLAANDVCSARGYDSASKSYSCTIATLGNAYKGFTQTVKTQFLNFQRVALAPPSTYTSQTEGFDAPAANLLGVTVKTTWVQGGRTSSFNIRSSIANAQADPNAITASLRASALDITSNLANGDILQFEGGLVSSEGSLTTGSIASLSVVSARAGLSSGQSTSGAALSLSAPPAVVGGSPSDSSGHYLDGATCTYACFGQTSVTGDQHLTVASGEPLVSTSGDPVIGHLRRNGSNTFRGYSYSNATTTEIDPTLGIIGPMVSAGSGATTEVLSGGGYIDATGSGSSAVRSSGSVALSMLQLFPTSFAPEGVVQVVLTSAALTCQSGGGVASSATPTWSGEVRYWSSTMGSAGGYVVVPLSPGAAALAAPSSLMVQPGRPLSTWVQAWSAMTNASAASQTTGRQSKGTVNAVLSLLTAQTRAGDATSPLNIAVGSLACIAEDAR